MTKNKIGIFGGSFDPFHYGHLNSMATVAEILSLDQVKAIPTSRTPMRPQTQGATPEQRLAMCERGISELAELIVVDRLELDRGGVSYTIDTLKALEATEPDSDFFLIIGLDQFGKFDEWKDFAELLERADLVVTSRPGLDFPATAERFPPGIRSSIEDFDGRQAILKGGHTIHFIRLQDVEASATEIRKKIRLGQAVHHLVPPGVEEFIRETHLYESIAKDIGDFAKFTEFCAAHLKEKGGIQVKAFDLTGMSAPTEYTLITSGTSTRHATSLAESLVKEVKKEYGIWPQGFEGQQEGRWIVVDYGALIIHSFYDFVRQEYRLEQLWKAGKEIPV
jgi:nicotinate-nucleotide adenylyltransferase